MNLRPKRQEEPDLNITPLIDVVFLLLIFFMVSTTFDRELELKIQLPEASGETKQVEQKNIEITVDAQGRYFINKQQVVNTQLETLKAALKKTAGDQTDVPLIISADGQAPHQSVIRVMDVARQLGLVQITFAVQKSASSE